MMQPTLFEGSKRLVYDEALELTLQSMQAYGPAHEHWGIAWSGGKDTWPQGWDGDEPAADMPMDSVFADGSVQPLLV